MVGTWTYSPSTNTITVTGGTVGAPAGFVDAWNADKAGTLTLKAATTPALNMTLTTQVRPADEVALKIDFVLAGTSAGAGDTIDITGTDKDDGAQTETLDVSGGNGTYTTTKWFKTITDIDCNGFNDGTLTVTQGQWGVIGKDASGNQYNLAAILQVGDGSTMTYFTDVSKQIYYHNTNSIYFVFVIKNAATFTLGILINTTLKTTQKGCTLQGDGLSAFMFYTNSATAVVNLYSCHCIGAGVSYDLTYLTAGTNRVWNCTYSNGSYVYGCINIDVFNTLIEPTASYEFDNNTGTFNKLTLIGGVWTFAFRSMSLTFKNCYIRGYSTAIFYMINSNYDQYLINLDNGNVAWTTGWYGISSGKVYRQYEFDLQVTDAAGAAIASATVTLKDKDNNTVFSLTTDANGNIATQTVSRGYYDQAHGNTLQEYSPHTLTISKTGYITYTEIFTLSAKTTWTISLLAELSGTADADDVITGETFYKNSYASQLTGTLALTGDALTIDVADKKTFYNTDPKTKLTGTKVPDPNMAITKQDYDRIVKEEVEPYQMATAVLLLQRQRDKRIIKALNNE